MNTLMVGQMENATQASIVTLFQQRLGYRCLGRWGDRDNSNIEQPCSMLASKKICRQNQYFGIKATQHFLTHRESGII